MLIILDGRISRLWLIKLIQTRRGAWHRMCFESVMPTFSLVTLNCFGVPTTSTRKRLLALARELNSEAHHVVCFQEVQSNPYRRLLVKACDSYPFSAFQPFLHAPKGGLLTLSRAPITSADFTMYEARGRWFSPAVADWILHKGILAARMQCDDLPVMILNTHLNANYRGDWHNHNHYTRHEHRQLLQLAKVAAAQSPDTLVIVAGDFNVPRGSWLYDEFIAASGMTDSMAGDVRPTYRASNLLPNHYAMPINFAFYRAPELPNLKVTGDLHFQDKISLGSGRSVHLSDHVAVRLELSWSDA